MRWNSNGELLIEGASGGNNGNGSISAYSTAIVTTSGLGSNYATLPSGASTEIVIKNRTSVVLEIAPVAGGASLEIAGTEDLPLPTLANSNEWQIRRKDLGNTPVNIVFLRIMRV